MEKLKSIIVGEELKREIIKQLEDRFRLNANMPLKEAFLEKDLFFRENKIKKLKVFYKEAEAGFIKFDEDVDIKIKCKYYRNAEYACMDFDELTGKFSKGVPIWKYQKNESQSKKDIRFFKNDVIYDEKRKKFYKVIQLRGASGNLFCISTNDGDIKLKKKEKRSFSNTKKLILIKNRQDLANIKKGGGVAL
jgi:hypothetical protein